MHRKPSGFKRRGHTPLTYLRSLQRGNGSFRYSRTSSQTPVWVTAQALDALVQKAFPLPAARRTARARARRAAPGAGTAPGSPGKHKQQGRSRKHVARPKPAGAQPSATTTADAPAQAPQPAPKNAPASVPTAQRILRDWHGGDSTAAWAGGALVAGVAAFALWRLGRRRGLVP
jgi:hypothetical protein